jgi:hypothetical protein
MKKHLKVLKEIKTKNPNATVLSGLNEAIIGMTNSSKPSLIYSEEECILAMMKDNDWNYETALEFLEFNTFGTHFGEYSPKFVSEIEIIEL